jgi:hypothetical protein
MKHAPDLAARADSARDDSTPSRSGPLAPGAARIRTSRFPAIPLALMGVFFGFLLLPAIRANPRLVWTYVGVGSAMLAWVLFVWIRGRALGRVFAVEVAPLLKNHYIQSTVQLCVYAYWGWYWRDVYAEAPQILSQVVFLYAFDALLAWSRGKVWRLGAGPLPIILSTNVFIWFKDDWYVFQFLLVATGAVGKLFIQWTRDGRRTHIFNPSAFTLAVFSIGLLATGMTDQTWGTKIATTISRPPHIYLEIFLLGLVVQYFFKVTLVTLSAAGVLMLLNVIYTASTGVYYFIDTYISVASFLGIHLLVTDPSTSPRTSVGKVMFGGLYGLAIWALYGILGDFKAPQFYDKLLPIPLLNLGVRLFDHLGRTGILGNITRWESKFSASAVNRVAMGCWGSIFLVMLFSGAVDAPHPGASIAFWKQAFDEHKHHAGDKLLQVVQTKAEKGSGLAYNSLGHIYLEGKLVPADKAAAARCFAKASELGSIRGSINVVKELLFMGIAESKDAVERALKDVEQECATGTDAEAFFVLGAAHEVGRERPLDLARARELYEKGCARGNAECCKALERLKSSGTNGGTPPQR